MRRVASIMLISEGSKSEIHDNFRGDLYWEKNTN